MISSKNFLWETNGLKAVLRSANETDRDALLMLYRSTRQDLLALPLPSIAVENLIAQQQQFQRAGIRQHYPSAQEWVLEVAQQVVASMTFDLGATDLRLLEMMVAPEMQRQGIARALLLFLQGQAKNRGVSLSLRVTKDNQKARLLYHSLGLQVIAEDQLSEQMRWCDQPSAFE